MALVQPTALLTSSEAYATFHPRCSKSCQCPARISCSTSHTTLSNLYVAHSQSFISSWARNNEYSLVHGHLGVGNTMCKSSRVAYLSEEDGNSLSVESSNETADSDDGSVNNEESDDVKGETLSLLEWPAICSQVAEFASTPMGIFVANEGYLPIGASILESEQLQAQTGAVRLLSSPLDFSDIEDLRAIIAGALSGNVCQFDELCRVRKTLSSACRLYDQVFSSSDANTSTQIGSDEIHQDHVSLKPLQSIMVGCDICSELGESIQHCLDCSFSTVLDRASPDLAAVRQKRRDNMKALEALLKETAGMVADAGGMDSALVTRRRARLCVAVRASHKGLLPGGVTLDVSNSGATLFVEPATALDLNNEEMMLAAAEQAAETAVLQHLTVSLIDVAESLVDLLERITVLDLACARAGYATWLGAVRPVFCTSEGISSTRDQNLGSGKGLPDGIRWMDNSLTVDIEGARHPLLLGTALPAPLQTHRFGVVQQKTTRRVSFSSSKNISTNDSSLEQCDSILPVPIDIKIRGVVKVVTITGPNTGGKTAALKTLGVAALMAKAGLYLPAVGQPRLPWFDCILADIGDDQSLERSLSTFSGHIQRVCRILEAGTHKSLVLLDEIGGGTDPSEGAALATAVLRQLAASVRLTLATTHSAELRSLKDQDQLFENASVEFDINTLRPTYRVLWGIAGQSNALNIANSLGFDTAVLARARDLVTKLVPARLGERTSELMVPLVKQCDEQEGRAAAAAAALVNIRELHEELLAEAHHLAKREARLRLLQETAIDSSVKEANSRMEQVILRFQDSIQNSTNGESSFSMRDAQAAIAAIVEEYSPKPEEINFPPSANEIGLRGEKGDLRVPSVGDKVVIRRLGKVPATVVDSPQGDSEYLTVQLGSMKMQVKLSEILTSASSSGATGASTIIVKQEKPVKRAHSRQPESLAEEAKYEVAVQTSRNTLDLRGNRVEEALRELEMSLASRAPQSVLFVVHGMGTGAVKEAVWQVLKKHPYVAKFEEESVTNAGCTIVYIK